VWVHEELLIIMRRARLKWCFVSLCCGFEQGNNVFNDFITFTRSLITSAARERVCNQHFEVEVRKLFTQGAKLY
jgi:hypothetical protein